MLESYVEDGQAETMVVKGQFWKIVVDPVEKERLMYVGKGDFGDKLSAGVIDCLNEKGIYASTITTMSGNDSTDKYYISLTYNTEAYSDLVEQEVVTALRQFEPELEDK